jgi:pteridine reductase
MTTVANRVALVTGSAKRRIGFNIAQALAKRGYALAIHYRTSSTEAAETVKEIQKNGTSAIAIKADLTDGTQAKSLIDETLNQFGRVDVLVNCAAIWKRKHLEDITANDVREHFEVNTLGTFLCCQHAGLAMVQQAAGGAIINFGDWAVDRPYLDYAAYFPSKGAVHALTRTFAVELGTRNPRVRANCIMPGPLMLPPNMPDAERREAIEATLVKREGSPEDAVRAVMFLIEDEFVTGVCLPVDGGRTVFGIR